jgi:hypothetical protein
MQILKTSHLRCGVFLLMGRFCKGPFLKTRKPSTFLKDRLHVLFLSLDSREEGLFTGETPLSVGQNRQPAMKVLR